MNEQKELCFNVPTEKQLEDSQKVFNWYTLEDLAKATGYEVETLLKGDTPLNKLSIDFEVETRLGGYKEIKFGHTNNSKNAKILYSEEVLKAIISKGVIA